MGSNKKQSNKGIASIAELINQGAAGLIRPESDPQELAQFIADHTFNINKLPADNDSILFLQDIEIGSRSNIVSVTGKSKSRKTVIVSAMISAMLNPGREFLGFVASLDSAATFLHVDTEQSYKDYYESVTRMYRDAGLKTMPDRFRSVYTRDADIEAQSEIVEHLLPIVKPDVVILDGVTDFVYDINDHKETARVGRRILKWSTVYNCLVIVVIHTTKTTGYMTGSFGTWLEKKSETVVKVDKPEENQAISDVTCQYSRDVPFDPFTIRYSKELARYETISVTPKSKATFELYTDEQHRSIVQKIFLMTDTIPREDIVKKIAVFASEVTGEKINTRSASAWLKLYEEAGVIYQDPGGAWRLIPATATDTTNDLPF